MPKLKLDTQRKYLFTALAILVLAGLIYRFMPFLQDLVPSREEIELRERTLIKYQKMVRAGKQLDGQLTSLKGVLSQLESKLLVGKTPSLAAVDIQKILHDIAQKSNIEIKSVKVLKPEDMDKKGYLSIPVTFNMIVSVRQFKEMLYSIENSEKLLSVINVESSFDTRRSSDIRCNVTVAGYMKQKEI
ncbi:MAG TPA: hypothetical protein HPP90_00580 [Deltaproteobacteria bacterium]|nr:hypothetical protein [Deltaproteobacteria bacterium]